MLLSLIGSKLQRCCRHHVTSLALIMMYKNCHAARAKHAQYKAWPTVCTSACVASLACSAWLPFYLIAYIESGSCSSCATYCSDCNKSTGKHTAMQAIICTMNNKQLSEGKQQSTCRRSKQLTQQCGVKLQEVITPYELHGFLCCASY